MTYWLVEISIMTYSAKYETQCLHLLRGCVISTYFFPYISIYSDHKLVLSKDGSAVNSPANSPRLHKFTMYTSFRHENRSMYLLELRKDKFKGQKLYKWQRYSGYEQERSFKVKKIKMIVFTNLGFQIHGFTIRRVQTMLLLQASFFL